MIRTRFAPSPTGFLHVGGAYGALFDYAFAKKHRGKFIVRIEDTDLKRQVQGAEKVIAEGLEWLGIIPDESPWRGGPYAPYRQSERLKIYQKYALQLVKQGDAYPCFCSSARLKKLRQEQRQKGQPPRYDGKCRNLAIAGASRSHVIRMKIPENKKIIVDDLIRGQVIFDSNLIDDQVILKSDGFPTYHLAVVVDDHLMKISHVVRGEEWLSSAPKHILLYQYFGWQPPKFTHTPLLRNPDKSKLSKRQGHTSLFWYRDQGYLPEALLNFLCLLGWSHPKAKEVFALAEFIKHFKFEDLSAAGPVFDLQKLNWLNGVYIRQKSSQELFRLIENFSPQGLAKNSIKRTVPLVQERMTKLSDYSELVDFLVKYPKYPAELLLQKGKTKKESQKILLMINNQLSMINDWRVKNIEKLCRDLASGPVCRQAGWKPRDFFMTLRVAVTGKTITPPLFESMALLGRSETLARLQKSLQKLG